MQNLKDISESKKFYNDRYAKGYMEQWPADKKLRVFEVIKSISLPSKGEALDFGCGNGVFTALLKDALPGWKIYGCDISDEAIRNARDKNLDCKFFVNDDPLFKGRKFDFIFSHHVLEHVSDIEETARQMNERVAGGGSMLHIFPCGNEGSFEWGICQLRKDGISKERGSRFFFEDEGHLRRMNTDSCASLFKKFGFILRQEFYTNQYDGALNWITRSNPLVTLTMFNPLGGKNIKAKLRLSLFLLAFLSISALRLPHVISERFYLPLKILFWPSKQIDQYLIQRSNKEWERKKSQRNGSEMYLYFMKES